MGLQRIEIKSADGTYSGVTVDQFLALPLEARLKHILDRTARFFVDGREVPAKEGMRLLREMTSAGAASGDGLTGEMTVQAFCALPLQDRVKLVAQGRVRIRDGDGGDVTYRDALQRALDKAGYPPFR
jgi:hypothetical protein